MRPSEFEAASLTTLLHRQKIATLSELKTALGTDARRTVFRKLGELAYRTSYSHRGRYYTLDEVANYDDLGLWSWKDVWFSLHGTLLNTATSMIDSADVGYFVDELDNLLHVATKDALRQLVRGGRVARERVAGRFLYCSIDRARRREQLVGRRALLAEPGAVGPLPDSAIIPDELRAAIVFFFSLLDEKQRRLYAGLESLKTGRGGDLRIAELLGLDRSTVARGRQELVRQDREVEGIRKAGAGRKLAEKKRQK